MFRNKGKSNLAFSWVQERQYKGVIATMPVRKILVSGRFSPDFNSIKQEFRIRQATEFCIECQLCFLAICRKRHSSMS
jgi:hypothetical protein